MKARFTIIAFVLTGIILCNCSAKDDVIIAKPTNQVQSRLVSSNDKTKQATSVAELENRFKGCKAHW